MSNDERTMVERKLSGVYTTVSFDIPWEWYADGARYMKNELENYGIMYTMDEILEHPEVIYDFQDSLRQSMVDKNWEWIGNYEPSTENVFSKEIADKRAQQELESNTSLQELVAKHGPSMNVEIPTHKYNEAMTALRAWKII